MGDDPLARSGLAFRLAHEPGVVLAGESGVSDLASALASHRPRVLLRDLGPGPPGSPFSPEASVDSLVLVPDSEGAAVALSSGARGVLERSADGPRLAAALLAVARGLVVLDPALAGALLGERSRALAGHAEPLTPREVEALGLLARGLSNKEIAHRLGISEHTAKFHVNAILGKLGVQSRLEAVVRAFQLGLVAL
ncbi:response regulator transcription factor [bacterium]|nr:response regulator transcription factor [bacterium]